MPNRHRRGPSGPHGPGVIAWAHITDDGIEQPAIVSGFGIIGVVRTAVGEYEVQPNPTFASLITESAVGASYRNSIAGVAGVCFFGNVLGPPPTPGTLAVARFQVFPGNVLESGDFDVWIIQ